MSSFKGRILKEIERREKVRKKRLTKKEDQKKIMDSLEQALKECLRHCKSYEGHIVELDNLHLTDNENFIDLAEEMGFKICKISIADSYFLSASKDVYDTSPVGIRLQCHEKELSKARRVCKGRLIEECNKIKQSINEKKFEDSKEDGFIIITVKSYYKIKTEYEKIIIGNTFAPLGLEFIGQQTDGELKFKIMPK